MSVFQEIRQAKLAVRNAIDRLNGTRAMKNLAMRDARMFDLVQKGEATSTEIYYADFGTHNPNGLDIVYGLDDKCVFRDLEESEDVKEMSEKERRKYLSLWAGTGGDKEFINIHSDYRNSPTPFKELSNIISHEHAHRRQGAERDVGARSTFDNQEMGHIVFPNYGRGVFNRLNRLALQFNHAVQDRMAWRGGIIPWYSKYRVSGYLGQSVEVQARMQEIMAQGYAEWQKMPTTQTELRAAMHCAGVKAPLSVLRGLYGTKEGRQALRDFRCSRYLKTQFAQPVHDINRVYSYATSPARKNRLWREAFPTLYGNMLELMGDRLGPERMGLGKNNRPVYDILRISASHDGGLPENLDGLLDNLTPDQAVPLLNSLANQDEDIRHPQQAEIIDRLLARPILRDAILNKDSVKTSLGIYDMDPMVFAMNGGRPDIVQKLIVAGADPFKDISFVNGLDGTTYKGTVLVALFGIYEHNKQVLNGGEVGDKRLRTLFKDAEMRENMECHMKKIEEAAKVMRDHYPDIDVPRTIKSEGGQEQTISLRELMGQHGLETGGRKSVTMQEPGQNSGIVMD